jgi:hypothetical protein
MKTLSTATVIKTVLTAIIILACGSSFADQKAEGDDKSTANDVKRETLEAVQAIKSYSIKQRDTAVKDVKAALKNLDARIDSMQNRIEGRWDEMDQASREQMRETLRVLRKKRNEVSEWYGGLKHSSAGAWDHVKDGFVEGYKALSNAFDKAESEFKEDASDGSGG